MSSTFVEAEILSQPDLWRRVASDADRYGKSLPAKGEDVAIVGCGTSWFMAMAYAAERESLGSGRTDAFVGSEFPTGRRYDRVILISRSGTTTEIVTLLGELADQHTVLITADASATASSYARDVIALPFADERSVVQTRFATTTLALLRAHLGVAVAPIAEQAESALDIDLSNLLTAEQVSFIGRGIGVGLALEAALKAREAAQFWAEAYPAMDYRHGPIAIAEPGRLTWALTEPPHGLATQVAATGAQFVYHGLDGMAALVATQRFAVESALKRGLDPDNPRSLTRSVILDSL